jgi:two-component system, LuxR family, sensor histidine kinase DctS
MTSPSAPNPHYWRLPALTVGLFLVLIAALVWLTRQYDLEEQQTNLVSDVLWMEQNLRFHMERNEDQLGQLAEEMFSSGRPSPQADARLRQLLSPDSALVQVLWLDPRGTVIGAQPPAGGAPPKGDEVDPVPSRESFRLAASTGRPVYSPVYPVAGGNAHFEVHVPYYGEDGLRGVVVGVYALDELLSREIPWWFSERYRVSAAYADGQEIASKSKVAPLSPHLEYEIPFEPPGHGVDLHVTAYRGETRWVPILLIAFMVILGTIIVWSLLQLRRHIGHRHTAEQALRDAMSFRKAMEDSLLTGLRARDLEGRITYVNPAFCKMTGYAADELLGRAPPMPYWDPEDLPSIEERQQQILTGNAPPTGIERRLIRKNGERFDALVFDAPLIDAEGRHSGWMGSVLDITEQKRMRELARQQEDRLQATARLVTMGEMASTLAHELNQPLAAISSYSAGCLNRLESENADPSELKGILAKLGKQAQRAGQIIKRVHDFVRRSEPKRELVDINALIREAIALVEPDSRKRLVRIEPALAPHLAHVPADPVMIEQVVINLIRNGMDAMADTPVAQRGLRITTRSGDEQVLIQVADRGSGIPPEAAARLFQPFYTTKAEGMGMGLNICRSIAELHRGKLGFEPHPGGGTIFTFALPIEPL